jgi:short-subunit dehydrogenase
MQVNYLGAVYCTHYALPYLKASRGLLVAISSLSGKTAVPTRTGYVASKHAMQGFFDTFRIELRGTGVDVLSRWIGKNSTM